MKNVLIKAMLFSGILLFTVPAFAQHRLLLKVKSPAALQLQEELFVAGNFNNWDPSKTKLQYHQEDSSWQVTIEDLPSDVYEFKFTRGNWQKSETGPTGQPLQNRLIKLSGDTTILSTISGWSDNFPPVVKKHTTSGNVAVMDTAFYMPQLDRKRRIWIYLPKGYASSKKRYPVLYMHDGQQVFDEYSGSGEWGVDEWLDSLSRAGKTPGIVVAIENGEKRTNEYNPFDSDRFGRGEGTAYASFIVNTLKPYVDKRYRTMPGKENTSIAGSSLGGLISYYAAIKYPEVFGKAGIFSPSFWIAPRIRELTDSLGSHMKTKMFFYMGELEGDAELKDMADITESLATHSGTLIYSQVDQEGRHNETAWRKWFPEFYKWMMADWTNYIIRHN